MLFNQSISRLVQYARRHGIKQALLRTYAAFVRMASCGQTVLFYCDLQQNESARVNVLRGISFECKHGARDLDGKDYSKIVNFWNPEVTKRHIEERFQKGATLWLVRLGGNLAGFGWTLVGSTMETHYYPLTKNDVHLFDFLVFPEYRGRSLNPTLVTYILDALTAEGLTRAFIEAAIWNHPQLQSLGKTRFHFLGVARKTSRFGRDTIRWSSPDLYALESQERDKLSVQLSGKSARPGTL
jgi:GNAT superfamily N-acetyltransferase